MQVHGIYMIFVVNYVCVLLLYFLIGLLLRNPRNTQLTHGLSVRIKLHNVLHTGQVARFYYLGSNKFGDYATIDSWSKDADKIAIYITYRTSCKIFTACEATYLVTAGSDYTID